MSLCDAHTANCWAREEEAIARQEEESERRHWEQVMTEVETWASDWEDFADLDTVSANERAQVLAFVERLREWLDDRSEIFMWQTTHEPLPVEPFLPAQQNTPVYPETPSPKTPADIPL